jgi:predicted MFS family arabinose efflux permease
MSHAASPLSPPSPDRYRYMIMLVGFSTLAGASGIANLFSVFYSTLLDEFQWSHAAGASVYSVNMLVVAASAPVVGWLLDRFGPRWLFTLAAALIGVAFLACSQLQNLGHFILFYGVLSALGQTALLSMTVVVARWFAHAQRGRAIGFADVGTGFGTVLLVPGSAWLIAHYGWRSAFVIIGLSLMMVLVPLNLLHRPVPGTAKSDRRLVSLSGLLVSRSLWLICMAHLFMTITMTMVNVHLVEYLVQSNTLRILAASSVLSGVSLVSLPGRMFFGWLADRLQPNGAFTVAMTCTMTGFVMLLLLVQLGTRWPLIAFVVIYGFAQGAGGIAIAAKTVGLFQGPFLGTIFMVVTLSGNLGAAFGAWFGGRLFDLSGSYTFTFITAIVSGVCAIALMWMGNRVSSLLPTVVKKSSSG